jgi:UTP-glucose-1-phosphate uridylyltransferase
MTGIRTAVFPVAGRGTRFLPATKASPKEMLPVVDKPLIQYAAEEALRAGARKLVFITGSSKRAIEDHFDSDHQLERELEAHGKQELLETVRGIVPSYASCIYIRQPAPLGLGHAVLCSKAVVGNEPFFIHLADDLIGAVSEADGGRVSRIQRQCAGRADGRAAGDRQVRHRRRDPGFRSTVESSCDGRKAGAGQGSVDACGGRPLRPHAWRL